jgi:hypothetical protein
MTHTATTGTGSTAGVVVDDLISTRLRAPDFPRWRQLVEASGGCAKPIRLAGASYILDRRDGAVVHERAGTVFAPCGNRRSAVCQACSDRYAADAFHLLRSGLAGDDTKNVPDSVVEHPRVFVTVTAPTFGQVHTRKITPRGHHVPCRCGDRHHGDDPRIGTALDADRYDYEEAVLWQAHAGQLWHRFITTLARNLAAAIGVPGRRFREHARLSYAKVAEYQRRGLVHFHAVIRLDGPAGPEDAPPTGLDGDALDAAIRDAARTATLTTSRPDGRPLVLGWGSQLDLRPVTPAAAGQLEDDSGQISDAALAAYIAKYATKTTGASEGPDRPIRAGDHIADLDVTEHHRRMMSTAWHLGGLDQYQALGLRRWAHMLGFRGHFLTKSRRYSITFTDLRQRRRTWRLIENLTQLGQAADTVLVINDWRVTAIGHRDDAERELAHAIAERQRTAWPRGTT